MTRRATPSTTDALALHAGLSALVRERQARGLDAGAAARAIFFAAAAEMVRRHGTAAAVLELTRVNDALAEGRA
jgi:putative effector of murein hydrolase